jgi:sulfite exporter TauE/SafE
MIHDILGFLKDLFMLKFLPELGTNASFGILFIFGMLTSIHCIGMCGGIAISQCTGAPQKESGDASETAKPWFVPSFLYNAGRVVSYTLAGAIVGGLGQIISFHGILKGVVPVVGGIFMIIMAVNLLGIFPALRRFNIRLPGFFAKKAFCNTSHSPMYIGLLSGLMPCGPLQIIQLYALGTGSAFYGALSILIFALGTVPLLFLFGAINTVINKKHSKVILKTSAVLVLILGVVMIGRGLALSGLSTRLPFNSVSADQSAAAIEENVQNVTINIGSDSFPPITVQKGIPVRWIIHADKKNLNKCNSAIVVPEYNIEADLKEGDTLVEFTPEKSGEFIYTCWMGMIKSKITVVEDLKSTPEAAFEKQTKSPVMKGKAEQGMCMAGGDSEPTMPAEGFSLESDDSDGSGTAAESNNGGSGTAEEANNANAAGRIIRQEFTGYIQDKHCFGVVEPEKDTLFCLKMNECEASGYGLAVKARDGKYQFCRFDEKGHELAKDTIAGSKKENGLSVVVKGTLTDSVLKVSSIEEAP